MLVERARGNLLLRARLTLTARGVARSPEAIAGAYFECERDALIHGFLTGGKKGRK